MNQYEAATEGWVTYNRNWTWSFCAVLAILILVLFYQTTWSMVNTWIRSETFAHGFLIGPIVIWLLWQKKAVLAKLSARPNYWVLIPFLAFCFLWLLAAMVDVLVIQQVALISILVSGLWVFLGNRITRVIAFPLAFLFFSVPIGEGLVPPLMEFTATFTVAMIKLTGIPVYREGLVFYLPSGNWSVVDACSGVRYLIASVTLGCLFAYLNYQSLLKRFLFIVAAIIVPIFANGLRAYIIVMIGHLSDMTMATGVDHLIYGWVFFGIVMLILFSVGSIWRDHEKSDPHRSQGYPDSDKNRKSKDLPGLLIAAGIILGLTVIWPLLAMAMEHRPVLIAGEKLQPPSGAGGWQPGKSEQWALQPLSIGASQEVQQFYEKGGRSVSLYLAYYPAQRQGEELINSQNSLLGPKSSFWRITSRRVIRTTINDKEFQVVQAHVKSFETSFLVWSWYRLGEHHTSNRYVAKILEAFAKLTFSRQDATWLVVATQIADSGQGDAEISAGEILRQFVEDLMPQITDQIDTVAGFPNG